MSCVVVSGGKSRRIAVSQRTLNQIAALLGITPRERQQGNSIMTVSTGKPQGLRSKGKRPQKRK